MRAASTVVAAALALATALATAACAPEPPRRTAGTMGTNSKVGEMLLRNVYVLAPEDGEPYAPGDDAELRMTLRNESSEQDSLVALDSAQARDAVLRWDRDCDGRFEEVSRIPVLAEGTVPGEDPAYRADLVDLTEEVRPGTTIPVTFTFRHAGEVTVDAMVEAEKDGDVPAPLDCE